MRAACISLARAFWIAVTGGGVVNASFDSNAFDANAFSSDAFSGL